MTWADWLLAGLLALCFVLVVARVVMELREGHWWLREEDEDA